MKIVITDKIDVYCNHTVGNDTPNLKGVRKSIHDHFKAKGVYVYFELSHMESKRLSPTEWHHVFRAYAPNL